MEEKIVSFNVAYLAEKKGFDAKCNFIYFLPHPERAKKQGIKENIWVLIPSSSDLISGTPAPSQSLLQKWLREEHNIEVGIIRNRTKLDELYMWYIEVYDDNENFINEHTSSFNFKTYELAFEIGLFEALNLIK